MIAQLANWLATKALGPCCPICGERLRSWRTLQDHAEREHPDAIPATTRGIP